MREGVADDNCVVVAPIGVGKEASLLDTNKDGRQKAGKMGEGVEK